jgi:UDP-glucose 4-epimerase
MMKKPRILVTGGLGYIGSHTVVELQDEGYEVIIIDNLSNSNLKTLDNIFKISGIIPVFYNIDMLNHDALRNIFIQEAKFDAVIHFAAYKAVAESVKYPLKYYKNNIGCLLNLLDCMIEFNTNNIVFSSSATVYGDVDELPALETSPLKPSLSSYGSTKQFGEDILQKTTSVSSINAISLRYFNPVGAHQSSFLGEYPNGIPNNLMPYITRVALGELDKLIVYGNNYNTLDGTCIRDYIHITDLAHAHIKSCKRLIGQSNMSKYENFNIGTGQGYSVLQVIKAYEDYNNIKINYEIGPRREGDTPILFANTNLAKNKLGWESKLSLKDIVTSEWKWSMYLSKNI